MTFFDDANKDLVRVMFDCLKKSQLDLRNSSGAGGVTPSSIFEAVCNMYNDSQWVTPTTTITELHSTELKESIKLPLEDLSTLTPEDVKIRIKDLISCFKSASSTRHATSGMVQET